MPNPIEYLIHYYTSSNLLSSSMYLLWDGTPVIGCDLRVNKSAICEKYSFVHRDTGEAATSLAIQHSIRDLQGFKQNHESPERLVTAQSYSSVSDYIIPQAQLSPLQIQSLMVIHQSLDAVYEGYMQFPALVQAALIDLNLHFGISACFSWNESLVDAIETQDWQQCAQISQRSSVCSSRNKFVYNSFLGVESEPLPVNGGQPSSFSPPRKRKTPEVNRIKEKTNAPKRQVSRSTPQKKASAKKNPVAEINRPVQNKMNSQNSVSTSSKNWMDILIQELEHSEGTVDHLYCDTVGYVTIGVGCMLPNEKAACEMPLRHRDTNQLVSEQEKSDAFHAVKDAFTDNARASYYKKVSNLYLAQEDIESELKKKLDGFIARIVSSFPAFESFPDKAKIGILDMAYNLGVQGVVKKFPTFSRGIREQNWRLCAEQCRRKQVSQERNDWVKNMFMEAGA